MTEHVSLDFQAFKKNIGVLVTSDAFPKASHSAFLTFVKDNWRNIINGGVNQTLIISESIINNENDKIDIIYNTNSRENRENIHCRDSNYYNSNNNIEENLSNEENLFNESNPKYPWIAQLVRLIENDWKRICSGESLGEQHDLELESSNFDPSIEIENGIDMNYFDELYSNDMDWNIESFENSIYNKNKINSGVSSHQNLHSQHSHYCAQNNHLHAPTTNYFNFRTFMIIYGYYIKFEEIEHLDQRIYSILYQMLRDSNQIITAIEFICLIPKICINLWKEFGQKLLNESIHSNSIYHQRLSILLFFIGSSLNCLTWQPSVTIEQLENSNSPPLQNSSSKESAQFYRMVKCELGFLYILLDCIFSSESLPQDDLIDNYIIENFENEILNLSNYVVNIWRFIGEDLVFQFLKKGISKEICTDILQIVPAKYLKSSPANLLDEFLSSSSPFDNQFSGLRILQSWPIQSIDHELINRIFAIWESAVQNRASLFSSNSRFIPLKQSQPYPVSKKLKEHYDEQLIIECIQTLTFQITSLNEKYSREGLKNEKNGQIHLLYLHFFKKLEELLFITIESNILVRYKIIYSCLKMIIDIIHKNIEEFNSVIQERVRSFIKKILSMQIESTLFLQCLKILQLSSSNIESIKEFNTILSEKVFSFNWETRESIFQFAYDSIINKDNIHNYIMEWLSSITINRIQNDPQTEVRYAAIKCLYGNVNDEKKMVTIIQSSFTDNGGDSFLRQKVLELFAMEGFLNENYKAALFSSLLVLESLKKLFMIIYNNFEYDSIQTAAEFLLSISNMPRIQVNYILNSTNGHTILQEIMRDEYFNETIIRTKVSKFLFESNENNEIDDNILIENTKKSSYLDIQLFFNFIQDQDCYD